MFSLGIHGFKVLGFKGLTCLVLGFRAKTKRFRTFWVFKVFNVFFV